MSQIDLDHSPILEVKNLTIRFKTENGYHNAVENVSFKITKGETLGIVGESGSGKSVSSLSIMQLLGSNSDVVSGEILFKDTKTNQVIDLLKQSEKEMRKIRGNDIAMIFQEPMTSLNPVYTCGDQVMEAILLHQKINKQEAKQRTIELFKTVLLPRPESIFSSYPHQLSGGQKQRVMIAMALSCNPSVIIADEPTTALDVTVQKAILEVLKKLKDEFGTSVIFITHDLGVITDIADRVVVMYQGKIVEQNKTANLFYNPKHPYTKGLMACRPRLDFKLKVLPTVSDFMVKNADGEMVEKESKYNSVGQAIMLNFVTEEETLERRQDIMSKPPHLIVKNLKTYFPVKKGIFGKVTDFIKAVDDVSFEVYPGETVGLVGESGCGKTTLGRTILRLEEPTSGDIIFNGQRINELDKEALRKMRKDMQIIFQDPYSSLNPRITIGEAIMEPMRIHEVLESDFSRRRRVIELLETVNLQTSHFNRYPHEFSGGQRQRICIARALALNPQFIICDESVSALDVSVQAQVLNLLNKLKGEFNFTTIFISHDLSVVKFMSDRIVVMNRGKIEEIGYAEDIYRNPTKEYTKKLIDAIPKVDLEDIRLEQWKRKKSGA